MGSTRTKQEQRKVEVRQEGRQVKLGLVENWTEEFHSCLGAWSGGIPRPGQIPNACRQFPVFKVPKGAPALTLEMVKAAQDGD